MSWLITGGAGYIGAHVVRAARSAGHDVIILDDLSTGIATRIPDDVILEKVSLTDKQSVDHVLDSHHIQGVVHLAAKKQVGESVARPDFYWEQNVRGFENLLDAMARNNVKSLVFSSSAAVYGQPQHGIHITEKTYCEPINPYGATKLAGEWLSRAHTISHGTSVAALRYFNVAGAGSDELGDVFEQNLVPIALRAITTGGIPQVFGNDYPTADGTCIRDYVHVQDLADAHVAAMSYVTQNPSTFEAINVGTGSGASVLQVLDALRKASGISFEHAFAPRREGDPATLVADVTKAFEVLGWTAKRGLTDIAESAWFSWNHD